MNYSEKLRDPRWQRKRLEVFEAARFRCQHCFDSTSTLHAHHTVYIKGREPWEYVEPGLVICLCDKCHKNWHTFKNLLDIYFGYLNAENIERAHDAVLAIFEEQLAEEKAAS